MAGLAFTRGARSLMPPEKASTHRIGNLRSCVTGLVFTRIRRTRWPGTSA